MARRICRIEECSRYCFGHGLCRLHYDRWRKHGDPAKVEFIVGQNRKSHPLYGTYLMMKARCTIPSVPNYQYYGGRGIEICERWLGLHGFNNFVEDMGNRPGPNYTLDRRDSNGNYEPSNCRWATKDEQSNNVSTNHVVVVDGIADNLCRWAKKAGLGRNTFNTETEETAE